MTRKDELDGLIQAIDKELAELDQIGEEELDALPSRKWQQVIGRVLAAKSQLELANHIVNPPKVVPTEQLEKEFGL